MQPSIALLVTTALVGFASPAVADAIDGHWCDAGRRHLEINGPAIVTPSGATLRGDYNRHGFKYQEPANGTQITMVLLSEVTMHLRSGDEPEETWHRCAAPTS
jgi:hypothetical protein